MVVSVGVSLSEALTARGHLLSEEELWALLSKSAELLQDLFIGGSALKGGRLLTTINPDTLQCCSNGRLILATHPKSQPWRNFRPPDAFNYAIVREEDAEKVYMHELGCTLRWCVGDEISEDLKEVLGSMCHPSAHSRLNLLSLLQVVVIEGEKRVEGYPLSHYVTELHREIMGDVLPYQGLSICNDEIEMMACPTILNSEGLEAALERIEDVRMLNVNQVSEVQDDVIGDETLEAMLEEPTIEKSPHKAAKTTPLHKADSFHSIDDGLDAQACPLRAALSEPGLSDVQEAHSQGMEGACGTTHNWRPRSLFMPPLVQNAAQPTKKKRKGSMLATAQKQIDKAVQRLLARRSKSVVRSNSWRLHKFSANKAEEEKSIKRHPITRVPSNVYRNNSNAANGMTGPEFVWRSLQPSIAIDLTKGQSERTKKVTVVMLTGQRIDVYCDPDATTAHDVFEAVTNEEMIVEKFAFGLACQSQDGELWFIEPRTKLSKVAPPAWREKHPKNITVDSFTLYFRVKFYLLPNKLRQRLSHYLLYLQLRHDLLLDHLPPGYEPHIALNLASLALQAECGDYVQAADPWEAYFDIQHYLSESSIRQLGGKQASLRLLEREHKLYKHKSKEDSQVQFVRGVSTLPAWGTHFFKVSMHREEERPVWLGVAVRGLCLLQNGGLTWFPWENLGKVMQAHGGCLHVHLNSGKQQIKWTFYTSEKKVQYLVQLMLSFDRFVEGWAVQGLSPVSTPVKTNVEEELRYYPALGSHGHILKCNRRSKSVESLTEVRHAPPSDRHKSLEDLTSISRNTAANHSIVTLSSLKKGVKMGTRVLSRGAQDTPCGSLEHHPQVIENTSVDLSTEESVSESLLERFHQLSPTPARQLVQCRMERLHGVWGLLLSEGRRGGVFIEELSAEQQAKHPELNKGDRIWAIEGRCVENLQYSEVVDILKSEPRAANIVVARKSQKPDEGSEPEPLNDIHQPRLLPRYRSLLHSNFISEENLSSAVYHNVSDPLYNEVFSTCERKRSPRQQRTSKKLKLSSFNPATSVDCFCSCHRKTTATRSSLSSLIVSLGARMRQGAWLLSVPARSILSGISSTFSMGWSIARDYPTPLIVAGMGMYIVGLRQILPPQTDGIQQAISVCVHKSMVE